MAASDQGRLSTGLQRLDEVFVDGGFPAGTVVTVVGRPESISELLVYNMAAGRPTEYLSAVRSTEDIRGPLTRGSDAEGERIRIHDLGERDVLESAHERIKSIDLQDESTLIVDPVNAFENADGEKYRRFLREFTATVRETDSVGILHALSYDRIPDRRWMTLHASPNVFEVRQDIGDESVSEYLVLRKLDGREELREGARRVFPLPRRLSMDIGATRNVTP